MSEKIEKIPAINLRFAADIEADESASDLVPVRLKARDSGFINHPWWGLIAHDFAGMQLHKDRLVIDYCHDTSFPIGFMDKFEATDKGLICSGALAAVTDKAKEVVRLLNSGVPLEASIDFSDAIECSQYAAGEEIEVNGAKYTFAESATVVRKWSLRGVAICPYGADKNTEASLFAGDKARFVEAKIKIFQGEDMTKKLEKPADEPAKDEPATENEPEQEPAKDEPATENELETAMSAERESFKEFYAAFGEKAAEYFAQGMSFALATAKYIDQLKAENADLRAQLKNQPAQPDVKVVDQPGAPDLSKWSRLGLSPGAAMIAERLSNR